MIEEPRNICGVILPIRIHRHDDVPPSGIESGRKCGALPRVLPEGNDTKRWVFVAQSSKLLERAVRRSVIDDQNLLEPLTDDLDQFRHQWSQVCTFVVHWQHGRNHRVPSGVVPERGNLRGGIR